MGFIVLSDFLAIVAVLANLTGFCVFFLKSGDDRKRALSLGLVFGSLLSIVYLSLDFSFIKSNIEACTGVCGAEDFALGIICGIALIVGVTLSTQDIINAVFRSGNRRG
jgi:hypothetical protein